MTTIARKPTGRSTVDNHNIPNFYSCYLLKSVRTSRSTATYIGSTPSPPRRIRQHNGEITAGAWKTKHNRPWVMQMIVYGFPSKLAALQFEWAWQHPHISRHLRDKDGNAIFPAKHSRPVKGNIQVVRTMVASSPYTMWPLHVKLFTEDAAKHWNTAGADAVPPLPPGIIVQVELEGVDGKSGKVGSGRVEPLDITDATFTTAHLAKHKALLASGRRLHCSICKSILDTYQTEALTSVLCPTAGCTAVAHLPCLSRHFLSSEPQRARLIPRGGTCPQCHDYILWGDIVRGCYRRHIGGTTAPELDEDENSVIDGSVSADSDEAEAEAEDAATIASKISWALSKGKSRAANSSKMTAAKLGWRALHAAANPGPVSSHDGTSDECLIGADDESEDGDQLGLHGPRRFPSWQREDMSLSVSSSSSSDISARDAKHYKLPTLHTGARESSENLGLDAIASGSGTGNRLLDATPTVRLTAANSNQSPTFRRRADSPPIHPRLNFSAKRHDHNQDVRKPAQSDSWTARVRTPMPKASERAQPPLGDSNSRVRDPDHTGYSPLLAAWARREPKPAPKRKLPDLSDSGEDVLDVADIGVADTLSLMSLSSPAPSPTRGRRGDVRYAAEVIEISD